LASDAELPFAPVIFAVWDDLPRLAPDMAELAVLRVLVVEWQRRGDGQPQFEYRRDALAVAVAMTERGVGQVLERLVERGLLGRTRDGYRGAARYDILPLLRLVRFEEDGNGVPVTRGEPGSSLASANGHREGNVVPGEGNVVPQEGNEVPPSTLGSARRDREKRMRGLPLSTADARRAALAELERVLKRGKHDGGEG
jgi:hypothetical protein